MPEQWHVTNNSPDVILDDRWHLLRLVDGCEVEGSVATVGALVHVAGVLQQPLQQSLVIMLWLEESQNTETIRVVSTLAAQCSAV